jgi:hypothetical protein
MFRSGGESIMPAPNFCLLESGKVVDLRPMESGKSPLVFVNGSWIKFEGTIGESSESRPITEEEALSLTSGD